MKIKLEDNSYYEGIKTFEMEDKNMGGDLALMVEYLLAYFCILRAKSLDPNTSYAEKIVYQAKKDKLGLLMDKYEKLVEFLQYVDGEEHAL